MKQLRAGKTLQLPFPKARASVVFAKQQDAHLDAKDQLQCGGNVPQTLPRETDSPFTAQVLAMSFLSSVTELGNSDTERNNPVSGSQGVYHILILSH